MTRSAYSKVGTLVGVFLSILCACSGESTNDREQAVLEKAIAEQQLVLPEKSESPAVQSSDPIAVVFDFDNMSLLMQQYFSNEDAVKTLTDALRYDPIPLTSPVVVRIRWVVDEGTRGMGEVAVVYDRALATFEQGQAVANALIKYRDYVGGAFDLRLLSFSLFLEGQGTAGCRLAILNPIGVPKPVISPCLEVGDDNYVLRMMGGGVQNCANR